MKLEAIDTHLVLMVEFITTVELFLNGVPFARYIVAMFRYIVAMFTLSHQWVGCCLQGIELGEPLSHLMISRAKQSLPRLFIPWVSYKVFQRKQLVFAFLVVFSPLLKFAPKTTWCSSRDFTMCVTTWCNAESRKCHETHKETEQYRQILWHSLCTRSTGRVLWCEE